MTETTHGNLRASETVLTCAWNMNLKCFWFLSVGVDILNGMGWFRNWGSLNDRLEMIMLGKKNFTQF